MVKRIFLYAAMILSAATFTSCDDDKEPTGVPEKIEVECIAQFENSMLEYIEVEATWLDAMGMEHHAYPSPHYLVHGNRQVSRLTVDEEFLSFPNSMEINLTYTIRDGVVDEDGFVDIPKEGVDVIVYTGATVQSTYAKGKQHTRTYDIASFINQNVLQEDFIATVNYLNHNCSRIYVSTDDSGSITTNASSDDDSTEEEGKSDQSDRPGRNRAMLQ